MTAREDLLCMFTAEVSEEDGVYTIEVPESEVELGTLSQDNPVRVGVYEHPDRAPSKSGTSTHQRTLTESRSPPVEAGDTREVTIEHIGDKGDGIAKIESGFVLIVPETEVGDELTVEIVRVNENFAIAEPVGAETAESDADS